MSYAKIKRKEKGIAREFAIEKLNQFKASGVELFANPKAYKEKLARLEVNVLIA